MPTILLSRVSASSLQPQLEAAGHAVVAHTLGSAAAVEFQGVDAALVEVGSRPDAAAALTRRWRVELGETFIPIVWVLAEPSPEQTTLALDAGADACLAPPLSPALLAAQIQSALRTRSLFARMAVRGAEARLLGDQLQKAHSELDLTHQLARTVQQSLQPQALPTNVLAVSHHARGRAGGDFYSYESRGPDHIGFFLADTVSPATGLGSLVATVARLAIESQEAARTSRPDPGEICTRVNSVLLSLGLEDSPFVAMLYGVLNLRTGELAFARAGLPAPVHLPHAGPAHIGHSPGPLLGIFNAEYPVRHVRLEPGDRFVLATDGASTTAHLEQAVERHRSLHGQAFVDALAADLLAGNTEAEDFTILAVQQPQAG